jgi:RHS repeat-associated protein
VSGGGLYAGLESPLRNYDSVKGRFDRPDPLGLGAVKMGDPGSWNRFAYVQGDPVNYRDPKGLYSCSVSLSITGLPEEHTLAEVYCESDGHTVWSYTPVTPFHGDVGALLRTFQGWGEQLDAIEWNRTETALRTMAGFIATNQDWSVGCLTALSSIRKPGTDEAVTMAGLQGRCQEFCVNGFRLVDGFRLHWLHLSGG